ncbi:restriction endonuclease subunit S [Sphaerospermopsis sp. FACHB-1194]|uniref:restriction endonuclease subunit S n=1 Tax=Sphaerospermopsis sp. FACHB-1194 TaxID=2692862 RepID=UPI0016816065|nr:restriction endonuclease subunit S [Sphaerospermopsis sp. FACHB-1194]MBD2147575.1 restriction endonuclease subunit S [Sphaerospermopsis sp. FACHB-1194]
MSIPDGFKVSEVGVIPEDWDVKRLGDIADVKTGPFGSSLHEKDYVDDGTPIITVEHLSDKGVVHKNLPMVSDYDKNRLSSYILKTGDIVFSRVGSVDRNSLIRNLEDGWLFSSRLLRIRINNKNIAPAYLSYHFLQESTKQRIRSVAVGQTMASLNTAILKGIEITLPPLAEQKAIAQSLSDVDNLITAIDKLITKKRNIKQGTMQELLTGKKRLPGFSGEWEVKTFKDVSFVNQGLQIAIEQRLKQPLPNSKKYITIQFLNNGKDIEYINDYSSSVCCNEDDVLMTRTGNTGIVVSGVSGVFHNNFFKINFDRKILDKNYLIAYLRLDKTQKIILAKAGTSTIPDLNHNDFYSIFIHLPSLTEQKAIAKILTEMDEEIEALEKKREKYKNIKQGMMQQLLTGKTRLKINLEDR